MVSFASIERKEKSFKTTEDGKKPNFPGRLGA